MKYYSRRELYAAGEMLGDCVTEHKVGGGRIYGGGGKGGGGGPQQTTAYQTNLPEYARPYVENMLNAGQSQIYNEDMTGFKPYQPYSSNPTDYFAGPSSLQKSTYNEAGQMQTPGAYGAAQGLAGAASLGSLGAGQNYANQFINGGVQRYMNPYLNEALQPQLAEMQRQYGISGAQQQGQATRAGAFGGTREALMNAENSRNMNMAMNQAIG
jgi:hypothetical protein